jgi:8-oxo-dGTP pyrophosphatase MutT (NUDIX family)
MPSRAPDLEQEIVSIDRVEITVEPWSWEFASTRRAEIDRYFADLQRERPAIWNGRVMLMNRLAVSDGDLRGTCFEADYASFVAWRAWNFPDPDIYNIFAATALCSADGAYLVGEMAPSTANGGLLYFPCGTPEPADVDSNGALDITGNLHRELLEETGIDVGELDAEPGWRLIRDRGYIGLLKKLVSRQSANELHARVRRFIANERQPEFIDARIVRGPADLSARMPRFVVAFLEHEWARGR